MWSIARVRPSGDQATPMTSGIAGIVARSVHARASGPFGGVGVGMGLGEAVGEADGVGVCVGGWLVACPLGAGSQAPVSVAMAARTTASQRCARGGAMAEELCVPRRYEARRSDSGSLPVGDRSAARVSRPREGFHS